MAPASELAFALAVAVAVALAFTFAMAFALAFAFARYSLALLLAYWHSHSHLYLCLFSRVQLQSLAEQTNKNIFLHINKKYKSPSKFFCIGLQPELPISIPWWVLGWCNKHQYERVTYGKRHQRVTTTATGAHRHFQRLQYKLQEYATQCGNMEQSSH